jgi:hypothetical protein|tara:strand:- start:230 stop:574 length:345 start_codon:yes stop_codon:yes gene_type:complete
MSSIGPIGGVASAPTSGTNSNTGASAPAGGVSKPSGPSGGSMPPSAVGGQPGANRGMLSNMSSSDFVSLTQKMSSSGDNMKNVKDMINMVLALQLLEKTMEAVGEIVDNFIGKK